MLLKFILPKFIIKVEKWKWNGEYRVYVSNLGNFKNEHKQLLPIKINSNGYCLVKTECGYKLAHRIVMLTWRSIPNAEELTVDHLDHNKRNNSLDNLEWVTKEENWERAVNDFVNQELSEEKSKKVSKMLLKGGQKEFTSFEEAAQWVKEMQQMPDDISLDKITNRITNAIKNNKMYCGRKWKLL